MKYQHKIYFDCAAGTLIFASLAYAFTGDFTHEIIGTAAILAMILHNALNWKFWQKIRFPRTKFTAGTLILNVALVAALIIVAGTGIMLSDAIFPFVPAGSGMFARTWHTTSAAWLFVLVAVHAGFHVPAKFVAKIDKICEKAFKFEFSGTTFLLALQVAIARYIFWHSHFHGKLIAQSSFDAPTTLLRFLAEYCAIFAFYFLLGILISQLLKKKFGKA